LISLNAFIQKTAIITPEKQNVQPRDVLEDPAFTPWFEVVKKPAFEVSTLHFHEIVSTNGFLTSSSFRKSSFQRLIPELAPVSLLESESRFEIARQLADTRKQPS
jgi:hypothetical protein